MNSSKPGALSSWYPPRVVLALVCAFPKGPGLAGSLCTLGQDPLLLPWPLVLSPSTCLYPISIPLLLTAGTRTQLPSLLPQGSQLEPAGASDDAACQGRRLMAGPLLSFPAPSSTVWFLPALGFGEGGRRQRGKRLSCSIHILDSRAFVGPHLKGLS